MDENFLIKILHAPNLPLLETLVNEFCSSKFNNIHSIHSVTEMGSHYVIQIVYSENKSRLLECGKCKHIQDVFKVSELCCKCGENFNWRLTSKCAGYVN